MVNPCWRSHDVTAAASFAVGEKRLRNCSGVRNWRAFGLPGVETDSAKAAASVPFCHGRYTRKATASVASGWPTTLSAVAHAGTLPASDTRPAALCTRDTDMLHSIKAIVTATIEARFVMRVPPRRRQ